MLLYLLQIVMILISYPLVHRDCKLLKWEISADTMYLFFATLILGSPMILRSYNVGVDTETYYFIYDRIAKSNSIDYMFATSGITAPVYVCYVIFLSRIFPNPQTVTIVTSIIILIGMMLFIKRMSNNVLFSVILYIILTLYYESMNGARQMMALVIMLNAYIYLSENIKSIKGWILFIFGVGIHPTSIIFILVIFGIWISKHSHNFESIMIKSLIFSGCFVFAFTMALKIFISIFPRYDMYVDGDNSASIVSSDGAGRIVFLYVFLLVIVLLYSLFAYNKEISQSVNNKTFFGVVFCVVVGICYCRNILFNRLLWFFLALFIVFIPNTFEAMRGKCGLNKYISYIFTFMVIVVFALVHLLEDKSGIIPYQFFWEVS